MTLRKKAAVVSTDTKKVNPDLIINSADNIPTDEFCQLLDQIVLMLTSMGSMMSTAFSGKQSILLLLLLLFIQSVV